MGFSEKQDWKGREEKGLPPGWHYCSCVDKSQSNVRLLASRITSVKIQTQGGILRWQVRVTATATLGLVTWTLRAWQPRARAESSVGPQRFCCNDVRSGGKDLKTSATQSQSGTFRTSTASGHRQPGLRSWRQKKQSGVLPWQAKISDTAAQDLAAQRLMLWQVEGNATSSTGTWGRGLGGEQGRRWMQRRKLVSQDAANDACGKQHS